MSNISLNNLYSSNKYWNTSGDNIITTNSGNLGIGTVTPNYKLHIFGNTTTDGGSLIEYPKENMTLDTLTYSGTSIVVAVKDSTNTSGSEGWRAFDGTKESGGWISDSTTPSYPIGGGVSGYISKNGYNGEWLMIDLGESIILQQIKLYSTSTPSTKKPKTFKIFASNTSAVYSEPYGVSTGINNVNWIEIYNGSDPSPVTTVTTTYIIPNMVAYRYYVIIVNTIYTIAAADSCQIVELELFGGIGGGQLISTNAIGIGISTPAYNLHVNGTVGISNTLEVAGNTSISNTLTVKSNVATSIVQQEVIRLRRDDNGDVKASEASLNLYKWQNDGNNSKSQLNFKLANLQAGLDTDVLSLRSDGRVGIGTTNPDYNLHIVGTANVTDATTLRNTLDVTGDVTINTDKFSVTASNGNTSVAGTLDVTGDVTINTDKFSVTAANGNTSVAGTLDVTGATTLGSTLDVTGDVTINTDKFSVTAANGNTSVAGTLDVTGDVTINTDKFSVTASNGNTSVAGTLDVTGATTLGSTLDVTGDVTINTDKFSVTAANGNTSVAGTLDVTGATTLDSTLDVTGDVGIGTVASGSKLHIYETNLGIGHSSTVGSIFLDRASAAGNSSIVFANKSTAANYGYINFNDTSATANLLKIGTAGTGVGNFVNIASGSGFVGINKDAPTVALDVNGKILYSTDYITSTPTYDGGTMSEITSISGTNDYYVIITSSGNLTIPITMYCDILIVGGGGAGGINIGGGGGGGAVFYAQNVKIPNNTYPITIGAGGNSTTAFGITAIAGGSGGSSGNIGNNGGSGGGASSTTTGTIKEGGLVSNSIIAENSVISMWNNTFSIYGNRGGYSGVINATNRSSGGGGGAGMKGINGNTSTSIRANGGGGFVCDITGVILYYGAGGGGAASTTGASGNGGLGGGGGGAGGNTASSGGVQGLNNGVNGSANTNVTGGAGGANTGSGGGGSTSAAASSGGSGVVIIRWKKNVDISSTLNNLEPIISKTKNYSVNKLTIYDNGRLGSGALNVPISKLHIYEDYGTIPTANNGTIVLEHGDQGGTSSIVFKNKITPISYSYIKYIEDASNSSLLTIGNYGESNTNKINITAGNGTNGFIGINKTTPTTTLDVNGEIKAYTFSGAGSNITNLNMTNVGSGTLSVSNGGTGASTFDANKLLIGNSKNAIFTNSNLHWDNINNSLNLPSTIITKYSQPLIIYNNIITKPIFISNDYYYCQFGVNLQSLIKFNINTYCDILMVGGGGSGYGLNGNGGSGGNLIYASNILLSSNVIYDIIVGKGGNNLINGQDTIAFGATIKGGINATNAIQNTANLNNILDSLIIPESFLISKISNAGYGIPITTEYLLPHNTYSNAVNINTIPNKDEYYYSFTNNGSIKFLENTICDVLLVGGGAAGGQMAGGKSGGILYYTSVPVTSNIEYPIIVGTGGKTDYAYGSNSFVFDAKAVGGGHPDQSNYIGLLSSGIIGCNLISSNRMYDYNISYNVTIAGNSVISSYFPHKIGTFAFSNPSYLEHIQVNGDSNFYYYSFENNSPWVEEGGFIEFFQNTICTILIIGGGGGSPFVVTGGAKPGGGGAGGIVYIVNKTFPMGKYNIYVGGMDENYNGEDSYIRTLDNNDVYIDGILLRGKGGGVGGGWGEVGGNEVWNGGAGGSGGGGGRGYDYQVGAYINGTGGQATQGNTFWNGSSYVSGGFNGGTSTGDGAGGGGAGGAANGLQAGIGRSVNITGNSIYYGGGGGTRNNSSPGDGDIGGGRQRTNNLNGIVIIRVSKDDIYNVPNGGLPYYNSITGTSIAYAGGGAGNCYYPNLLGTKLGGGTYGYGGNAVISGSFSEINYGGNGIIIIRIQGIVSTIAKDSLLSIKAGGIKGEGYTTNITGTNYVYSKGGYKAIASIQDTTPIVNIGSGGDGRIGTGTYGENGGNGTVIIRWKASDIKSIGSNSIVATLDNTQSYKAGNNIIIDENNIISSVPYMYPGVRKMFFCSSPLTDYTIDVSIGNTNAKGFNGGFTDGQYAYLIPYNNGIFTRINLQNWSSGGVSYLNVSSGNINAKGFSGGFTDGQYAYLIPYNNGTNNHGIFTRVNLQNWSSLGVSYLDVSLNNNNNSVGFKGGFTDGLYGYLVPNKNGIFTRIDLQVWNSSGVSYLDVSSGNSNAIGFNGGFTDGIYGYLVPNNNGITDHGIFTRVNLQKWTIEDVNYLNVTEGGNTNAKGFNGGFTDGRYCYLVPGINGILTRIEIKNWSITGISYFDVSTKNSSAKGFSGGFTDGIYGYLIPFMLSSASHDIFTRIDLQNWTLKIVKYLYLAEAGNINAKGFNGGFTDGRYAYLIPYQNSSGIHGILTRVNINDVYNSGY